MRFAVEMLIECKAKLSTWQSQVLYYRLGRMPNAIFYLWQELGNASTVLKDLPINSLIKLTHISPYGVIYNFIATNIISYTVCFSEKI